MDRPITTQTLKSVATKNLIFVSGKGGVGKTVISKSIARAHAAQNKKTLWICIEDPLLAPAQVSQRGAYLTEFNCTATEAFQEYVATQLHLERLTRIFLQNKLIRYLAQAAPGLHELVLLGKIWSERNHYDHVVVDMPSTGYGLAMFQSTKNFSKLFSSGPLHRDADAMLTTFSDRNQTGHLIVALPEEMPLRESLELEHYLNQLFDQNPPAFLANRKFPDSPILPEISEDPDSWQSPAAETAQEYASKRTLLERDNLKVWTEAKIDFSDCPWIPSSQDVIETLSLHLRSLL